MTWIWIIKICINNLFSHEMSSILQKKVIAPYFFSIAHPFNKFKKNIWIFYLFGQIWTMYNCTYHDSIKVNLLTSLTTFTHKMTSVVQKNLIVRYFFSITHPYNFYLFEQVWTMYNCTYHNTIRWSCWSHLEVSTSLWLPS